MMSVVYYVPVFYSKEVWRLANIAGVPRSKHVNNPVHNRVGNHVTDEEAELVRWEDATWRASGSTDITAAARLLRL